MLSVDDDDDYFIPTTSSNLLNSSRRLAMLFNPEEISGSSGGGTGHHADLSTNFRFVAPKQPRPGRSNSSASSGTGQASKDGQEVLLDVHLSLLPQGAERSRAARTAVSCQVVGNAVRRSFILVMVVQDKGELWRAAIDSHLLLEVLECSTLRVTAHGKSLTLLGEAQRIEDLVTQLAIYRAVTGSGPSHQDLCVGKGHALSEGDVAKVHCSTHTITSAALKGEVIENVNGMKVTVSSAAEGGWESYLAGATVDSHRLIFLPKQRDGKWLPPTTFHNITVLKVKTKGSKDKPPPAAGSTPPPVSNNTSLATQQQQQTVTSQDAPLTTSPNFTGQNGDTAESQGHNAQEDREASRKAALVSRMAQLGTPLFPPLPSAKVPQSSEGTGEAAVEMQEPSVEEVSIPAATPTPSTQIPESSTSTIVSAPTTTSSSALLTSTCMSVPPTAIAAASPVFVPTVPHQHQTHSPALDSTLALSICQLGTSVARISDKVDLLLTKVDKVEAGGSCGSGSPAPSDPEALMALAGGLVAHNERLRGEVEALERKLCESQTSCASLLTMNAELLEEKRELLRREAEQRKEEEEDKQEESAEDLKDKEEPVKEQLEKDTQTEAEEGNSEEEDKQGLMAEQVRSLVKSTLSGLFRHLSDTFSEEEQHSRPEVLRTVKSGLQVAYSTFVENFEEIVGVEETAAEEEEGSGEEQTQHEEDEKRENTESHNVEVRSGESDPEQE
ncbi:FK506-binding protein 15-like isoform X2 [Portunus trituberculatus]|uniref:FK506-binding protein 15-like isoform X2 n=1 Tax=Portunus trituberculatus TaxID=210409 RepID=UPI001E1D1312|nr:FK506-binding protein 15-like isoform X2 [Portunus trituberculatus]